MNSPIRSQGVALSPGQMSPGRGQPETLQGFAEMKTYGIQYVDGAGAVKVHVAVYIGGQWYLPPNGESYAASLQPLAATTWLTKLLEEKRLEGDTSTPVTVPDHDAVNVTGS